MRKLTILAVLALAACGENAGWNPNYTMNSTDYGQYLRNREAALTGRGPVPAAIPVQLPVKAPTAQDIAGAPRKVVAVKATVQNQTVPARPNLPANVGSYENATPVLVRFAHAEKQNPGQTVYSRNNASVSLAERECRKWPDPARAQVAFLAAGGPVIDPKGMDPDGDGFVCGWDPRPYRQSQL